MRYPNAILILILSMATGCFPAPDGRAFFPVDNDGDGFTTVYDCDDRDATVHPDALEVCNGVDDNCNGLIDVEDVDLYEIGIWYIDWDGDGFGDSSHQRLDCIPPSGFVGNQDDCDDSNPDSHPGAFEACDGLDNDCDGLPDSNDPDVQQLLWYADIDGDGFGWYYPHFDRWACEQPAGTVDNVDDCDDNNPAIGPC